MLASVKSLGVIQETHLYVAVYVSAPLNQDLDCNQCFPRSQSLSEPELCFSVVLFTFWSWEIF